MHEIRGATNGGCSMTILPWWGWLITSGILIFVVDISRNRTSAKANLACLAAFWGSIATSCATVWTLPDFWQPKATTVILLLILGGLALEGRYSRRERT
jgi:FtsH-binding integral membrane protein